MLETEGSIDTVSMPFLWENQKVIERGGHRRRAHHPIVKQGNTTKAKTLT